MAHIHVPCPHSLGKDEALKRSKALLASALAQHGDQVKDLVQKWNGYHADFSFSVKYKFMKASASGTIDVTDTTLVVDGEISAAAAMFKGKIERTIKEHADKALSSRSVPAAPKEIRPETPSVAPVRTTVAVETPTVIPAAPTVVPETPKIAPETPIVKAFDWAEYRRQIEARADQLR